MSKEAESVKALIDIEVMSDYECDYEIECLGGNEFEVTFEECRYHFNSITIRVDNVDSEDLECSKFSINVYEDTYEEFTAYSNTVKELWKGLLWK